MRRLIFMMLSLPMSACLIPPDRPREPIPPFPPEVDFSTLVPEAPRLRLRISCPSFRAEVPNIVDLDSLELLSRWVVNNNLPGTRLLFERTLTALEPGRNLEDSYKVVPAEDLDIDGDGAPDPSVLSFFVTDAPAWASSDGPSSPDTTRDLGRPLRSDESGGGVVEVRWAFDFSPVGECPR